MKYVAFMLSALAVCAAQSTTPVSVKIISNAVSVACIGAPQPSSDAPVLFFPCGSPASVFLLPLGSGANKQIRLMSNPNFCVSARGQSPAPLVVALCNPADPLQKWTLDPSGSISQSNLCITLPQSPGPVGALPCNNSPPQKWTVTRV